MTTQVEDTATKLAKPTFAVKGKIQWPDGSPAAGAQVQAFDKDLRHEQKLGETVTAKDGCYEITYSREQFRRAEKEPVVVRVYDQERAIRRLLVELDMPCNTRPTRYQTPSRSIGKA